MASHESIIEVNVANRVAFKDAKGKAGSYEFDVPYDLNMMEDMYQSNKSKLEKDGISKEAYFKQLEEATPSNSRSIVTRGKILLSCNGNGKDRSVLMISE